MSPEHFGLEQVQGPDIGLLQTLWGPLTLLHNACG
jgi:hypothetical protein